MVSSRKKPNHRKARAKRHLSSEQGERSWHLRLLYFIGTLLACAAVAQAGYRALLDSPYFMLKEIRVVGVSPALARDIELLVKDTIGEHPNTLALKVHEIRQRLAEHPRLRNLSVEIAYPNALVVTGVERLPVAILSAGSFYLVARDGVVLERLRPSELRRHELPYITGISEDAVQVGQKVSSAGLMRALEMLELLRERDPDLYGRFSEVNVAQDPVSELDNVTARLRGGMEVRFGDTNPAEKLALLDYFIQQQQSVGHDPFAMAYVDLRVPNQIVYLDKVTAAALRAGAAEPILGSMGSQTSPPDAGAAGARTTNTTMDDVSKDAASSAQKKRSATLNAKKSSQDSAKLASEEIENPQSVEQNPSPSVEQDSGPRRSSWRPRLPFRFFGRKSQQVDNAPVLLAPSDPGEQ